MNKRILIPTDFSESSLAAIRHSLERIERRKGMLLLLHVVEGDPVQRYVVGELRPFLRTYFDLEGSFSSRPIPPRIIQRDLCEEAQWKLASVFPPGCRNRVRRIVTAGKPADEIVRVAREQHADLIIMGTRRRSTWRRLFRKAVAEKVRRKASIPVILLEAPERDAAAPQGIEDSGPECCRERRAHAMDEMTPSSSLLEDKEEVEAL